MKGMKKEFSAAVAELAMEVIDGMDDEWERESALKWLNDGMMEGEDRRIKKCAFCAYYFRDKTKNNSSKTCGSECKTKRDTLRRKVKLEEKRAENPSLRPRKTNKELFYYDHYEYSFWVDTERMTSNSENYETPKENIAEIKAAKERYDLIGGRIGRRSHADRYKNYYDGNWNYDFK